MPALPAAPRVIRVDFFQTIAANSRVRDRIFLQYSGALSNTDLATVLATISAAWATNISPLQENVATLNSIEGTDLSTASSAQAINSTSHAGTGAGAALPNGVAAIVKFKIARRYRGGHPRFYLGGLSATNVVNGEQIAATAITAIQAAFAAFIAACVLAPPVAVGTLVHVNVSFFLGFANVTFPSGRIRPRPTLRAAPLIDNVISYSVNPNAGSQRRRYQQSV